LQSVQWVHGYENKFLFKMNLGSGHLSSPITILLLQTTKRQAQWTSAETH